eukprot:15341742-Ditylum_brightwellii.AAC.2
MSLISFSKDISGMDTLSVAICNNGPVGHIHLPRFSRAATAGYINAVNELEKAGTQTYILDVQYNHGGIVLLCSC